MLISDLIRSATTGITTNKSRTFLTMLGIIIGVGAVVLMVSIGNSFQNYVLTQIESVATNTMDVFPVGMEKFAGKLDSLTIEDYEAIKKLSTVDSIAPVIVVPFPVEYGKEKKSPIIFGTRREIFPNLGLKIEKGRLLNLNDEESARSVAVLSAGTAEELFGNRDPLGKKVSIGGFSFTVVGVLKAQGSLLLSDLDKPVYIPFTAARGITGQKYLSYMSLKTVGDPELAKLDVKALLRQRHRIDNPEDDPDKDDFIARSSEQIATIVNSVTLGLTVFLSLIAGISLLVGGIGIMNIMMVSVTERTREIGLRKAIGAKRRDILLQFLLEAVTLTFLGGAIGIIGGGFTGWLLTQFAAKVLGNLTFVISIPSIIAALTMAITTGLVFGLYPARRASQLDPIEALRFE